MDYGCIFILEIANYVTIRIMKIKSDQRGVTNVLLVPLIISAIFFVATLGFAVWAYTSRQDYKDNSDQKAAAAVEVAEKRVAAEKDNEFLEKEKFPLRSYKGPADLGSLSLSYPKTWSGLVSQENEKVFIFTPDVITEQRDQPYALRILIEDDSYDDVVTGFDSLVREGKLTAKVYSLPKLPDVVGLRFDGEIDEGKPGAAVILPLRDKTVRIMCEIPDRLGDFNNIILPNISFNP